MIKVPFKSDPTEFSDEMKPKISGSNLNLEYQNIESSLYKIAAELPNTISQKVYDFLVNKYESNATEDVYKTAIDYLQRAMLHFTIYEHTIFLIAQISNDGIVVKKNQDETTIFKYQEDILNNKLITTAWFWINQLIKLMNDNPDKFPDWIDSDQKKDMDDLPIDLSDFNKWVGTPMSGGEYFMINISWLIREVWLECVCSRIKEPKKTNSIARAVCYEVLGRACKVLAYFILPEPIRKDVDNEMGKNQKAQDSENIRENISMRFLSKAQTYWNSLDLELKKKEMIEQRKNLLDEPVLGRKYIGEDDKFCMT